MREILFRGKRLQGGDWVEGYYYKSDRMKRERESGKATLIFTPDCDTFMFISEAHNSVMVIAETVGQYTGLIDKNGKKIFEGDIVKVNDDYDSYGLMAGEVREVWFNFGGYRLKPKYESSILRGDRGYWVECGNDFEVIGNIHDNPELLEEK